jgi:vancomycin resistance protein YoaR
VDNLPAQDRSADRRVISLLLVGLVVLFGGLYAAGWAFASDKVPRGTTVAGVEIGGLRPAAATDRLEERLAPRLDDPVVVVADGRRVRIDPAAAGFGVDYAESVDRAGGARSWQPGRLWNFFFAGGEDLDAVVTVDGDALSAALEPLTDTIDQPPVNGAVTFTKGRAQARMPQPGQKVDLDSAAASITQAIVSPDDRLAEVDVTVVEPEITAAEVDKALREFARPAMSAPVRLAVDGEQVVLRPRAYARALSMVPRDGVLAPRVDRKQLMRVVRPALSRVVPQPRPATVRLVDGEPKVVRGKNGVGVDPATVVQAFPDLLTAQGEERRLELDGVVKRPEFTVRDARDLKIKEVVSSFTTEFPHSDYRNVNLGRAAELVNGTVLKPGETFSLNGTVGERTAENGFTKGFIISNGVYKEDYGGGVSQVATTLFNAAFFAGLEDVEHKPHSFYISRYPIGREATVVWGAVDLRFKNDTPYGILIESWIEPSTPSSSGSMNVRFWSTKYWDITAGVSDRYDFTEEETRYIDDPSCVPHQGYGGFDIDVYRYFRKPGSDELVRRETMHTTYTPSDTVICAEAPDAA